MAKAAQGSAPLEPREIDNEATSRQPGFADLFGTPMSGELITSGYLAISIFSGVSLMAGALTLFGSRWRQNPKLAARV
ncbi:hypothetical protein GJ744_009047 [Endocarpon pusillum]|uniref:Uncharacterized protein n=1 Tax=Endocarpon pusillum TaxID=364733 RepID=A0A8H7AP68_9EURO|nr:hypothetical protein GJ744_009047 [Endocarpon pusillum]